MTVARGFILQATYRVVTGREGERHPVVQLYGRLEDGATFLVRDDRQRPHFFVRADDAARAAELGARPRPTAKRTFEGASVDRVEVEAPPDVPALRDRLQKAGVDTFEADVRFASRYLIERGCEIAGDGVRGAGGIAWTFHNPALAPASVTLEPRVLSFDIETDPEAT